MVSRGELGREGYFDYGGPGDGSGSEMATGWGSTPYPLSKLEERCHEF